mgnify:CR=1 FL=1
MIFREWVLIRFACSSMKFHFYGKDRIRLDKENKVKISAFHAIDNELPTVTVSFEDCGTTYTFNGIYCGGRAVSAKLLNLMEQEENQPKGADK